MNLNDEEKQWMKKVVERSGKGIAESEIFCSIFTPNYVESPQCALELGLAILMDKPIALLVLHGQKVPPALARAAAAIEEIKGPDDLAEGTKRLLKKLEILKL